MQTDLQSRVPRFHSEKHPNPIHTVLSTPEWVCIESTYVLRTGEGPGDPYLATYIGHRKVAGRGYNRGFNRPLRPLVTLDVFLHAM